MVDRCTWLFVCLDLRTVGWRKDAPVDIMVKRGIAMGRHKLAGKVSGTARSINGGVIDKYIYSLLNHLPWARSCAKLQEIR